MGHLLTNLNNNNWTILFIGGASGTGKSSAAYSLARHFQINVLEADDIHQALKATTVNTKELLPAIHDLSLASVGISWMDIGVNENVKWLTDVSKEMEPALRAIVENHLDADVPVIIEGDFIIPEFTLSFDNPKVKSLFIHEPDRDQILQNFHAREGGELQHFRAEISIAYGNWLADACIDLGIPVVDARPWNTVVDRMMECLQ